MDKIIETLVSDFANQYGVAGLPIEKQFERFSNYCVVSARGTEETFDPDEITVEGDEFGIDGLAVQINGRIVTDPEEVVPPCDTIRRIASSGRLSDAYQRAL